MFTGSVSAHVPEPGTQALSMCAVQSLQSYSSCSQARQHMLSSNFEHEGCILMRCTDLCERIVATHTTPMCTDTDLGGGLCRSPGIIVDARLAGSAMSGQILATQQPLLPLYTENTVSFSMLAYWTLPHAVQR